MHPTISSLLQDAHIIPVLVIEQSEDAVPLAQCLVENGLQVLEVTLRSDAALGAVEAIAREVPNAVVGVGSILSEGQMNAAQSAGGQFGVSPGVSPRLLQALEISDWPFLPGAGSLSEILTLREAGFSQQKLFPASIVGGVDMLKAIAGPVRDVAFCPTGGVTAENAGQYLALETVFAVGGSWIAPPALVRDKDWDEIGRRAKRAVALG